MSTANVLVEWAIRSSVLIGSAALLLWLLRVKDASIRLAVCIAALCGSLAMPLLTAALPGLPVLVRPAPAVSMTGAAAVSEAAATPEGRRLVGAPGEVSSQGWGVAAAGLYSVVAGVLLLRLGIGLLIAGRLRSKSWVTDLVAEGIEVRESNRVTSPVTLGIIRPAIVLPPDWRDWGQDKLSAVLAHEQSHVQRRDPAVQCLSAIHRALLWHSPLSWLLHGRIVRLAEELSDDAAVAVTRDRSSYAELLLEFMQRGMKVNWQGIAMARYGSVDNRIHRILNGKLLTRGVTRGAIAAIFLVAVPVVYVAAAAGQQTTPSSKTPANPGSPAVRSALAQAPENPQGAAARSRSGSVRKYIVVLGDTQSGSWDSRESVTPEALRARFGNRLAWFREGGSEHVTTDEGVLREIERAMEPQRKVNAQQDRVNQLQSVVNQLQDKVNRHQNDVNAVQDKVNVQQNEVNTAQNGANKRQDLINRIQDAASRDRNESAVQKIEALLKELRGSGASTQEEVNRAQSRVNIEQERVNKLQHEVNVEQNGVNAEQGKVNLEQSKVNELQSQVSSEFSLRIQEIFQSALRQGLTKVVN